MKDQCLSTQKGENEGCNHRPVVVHDGVDAMSNRNDRAGSEFSANSGLDEVVRLRIHGCCRLVQDEDPGATKQRPGKAY